METSPTEFAPLRARLGRMLGLPAAITEAELHAANLALTEMIEASVPTEYIAQRQATLPRALRPLLLVHLASAWAEEDNGLATALENFHCWLAQPQAAPVPV